MYGDEEVNGDCACESRIEGTLEARAVVAASATMRSTSSGCSVGATH